MNGGEAPRSGMTRADAAPRKAHDVPTGRHDVMAARLQCQAFQDSAPYALFSPAKSGSQRPSRRMVPENRQGVRKRPHFHRLEGAIGQRPVLTVGLGRRSGLQPHLAQVPSTSITGRSGLNPVACATLRTCSVRASSSTCVASPQILADQEDAVVQATRMRVRDIGIGAFRPAGRDCSTRTGRGCGRTAVGARRACPAAARPCRQCHRPRPARSSAASTREDIPAHVGPLLGPCSPAWRAPHARACCPWARGDRGYRHEDACGRPWA